jgi:hypothetical protein
MPTPPVSAQSFLHPSLANSALTLGNATPWNRDYAAIERALRLREPLEHFISSAIRQERASQFPPATLSHDALSPDDWQELHLMLE